MRPAPTKLNALRVALVQQVVEAQAIAHRMQRVDAKLADAVLKQVDALALAIRSQHGAGNGDLELFFVFPSNVKLPELDHGEAEPHVPRAYTVISKERVVDADAYARSMAMASQMAQAKRHKELSPEP